MSLLAHADLCRITPIFQGKRLGNWNRKSPFRGELCVVAEHVIARCASRLPGGANANTFFVRIRKTEDTVGIAVHDLDQVGQSALDLSSMERKVSRSSCKFANALDHSVAVRCYLRAKFAQAAGKRLARRCDDVHAAKQWI